MKRQKRSNKAKMPSFVKQAKDFALQKLMAAGVAVVFAIVLIMCIKAFLYGSDYFRLRVVEAKGVFVDQKTINSISGRLLNLYRDRNIFKLNLKSISESIQEAYPDARNIFVKIVMPDKLAINLKFRKPFALVKDSRLYAVDDEASILPSIDTEPLKGLTVIEGVGVRYDGRRARASMPKNLGLAVRLLSEIKDSKAIAAYGVDTVDAGKLTNLSFYLKGGVEVKIGCENFKERLAILESTLKDPRLVMDKIKYIDVRFEEVVVGPKE